MAKMLRSSSSSEAGGIAFIGCILMGAGSGWIVRTEWLVPGMIIGLGVGFLVMAAMSHRAAK